VHPFSSTDFHRYETITVLRGLLLKNKSPEKYVLIESLETHMEERRESIAAKWPIESAIRFVMKECNQTQFTEEEIVNLIGVLAVNAFTSDDPMFNIAAYR